MGAVVSVMVVVMQGVLVLVVVIVIGGGRGWRCLMVDMVGCGGWCWSEVKVQCAPAGQKERAPAALQERTPAVLQECTPPE